MTVAVQILTGRERRINPRFLALASPFNFEPLFCMPARGNLDVIPSVWQLPR